MKNWSQQKMHDNENAEAYLTHENKCNNPKQNIT